MATNELDLTYDYYLAAPADAVWKAITDGAEMEKYFYGTRLVGRLERGASLAYEAGGASLVEGRVIDIEHGKRLVSQQRSLWDEKVAADPASTVRWELTAMGPKATRLVLVHGGFDRKTETYEQSARGWPVILSSLKTLVETGAPLVLPQEGA